MGLEVAGGCLLGQRIDKKASSQHEFQIDCFVDVPNHQTSEPPRNKLNKLLISKQMYTILACVDFPAI